MTRIADQIQATTLLKPEVRGASVYMANVPPLAVAVSCIVRDSLNTTSGISASNEQRQSQDLSSACVVCS